MPASERLQKALDVGDVVALFPVLKDWPTDELQALVQDAEAWGDAMHDAIDKAWKKVSMEPGIFVSETLSRAVDRARDDKEMQVVATVSEICSVAFFYLQERGVKT